MKKVNINEGSWYKREHIGVVLEWMYGVEEFNTSLLDSWEEKWRLRHTRASQRVGILPDQQ